MSKVTTLWGVFYRDRIATQTNGVLAVFRSRDEARAWIADGECLFAGAARDMRVCKLGQIDEAKRIAAH